MHIYELRDYYCHLFHSEDIQQSLFTILANYKWNVDALVDVGTRRRFARR